MTGRVDVGKVSSVELRAVDFMVLRMLLYFVLDHRLQLLEFHGGVHDRLVGLLWVLGTLTRADLRHKESFASLLDDVLVRHLACSVSISCL